MSYLWFSDFIYDQCDCEHCDDNKMAIKGCESDSPILRYQNYDGEVIARCPANLIEKWIVDVNNLNELMMQAGVLPNSGGFLDQSAVFKDCISAIHGIGSKRYKA